MLEDGFTNSLQQSIYPEETPVDQFRQTPVLSGYLNLPHRPESPPAALSRDIDPTLESTHLLPDLQYPSLLTHYLLIFPRLSQSGPNCSASTIAVGAERKGDPKRHLLTR